MTHRVRSQDGTAIAYDQAGAGPAVILVGGALSTRGAAEGLTAALAPSFTMISYDRRGRGESGDTLPYAPEREVEDLAALVEVVGGTAFAFGVSSGAALILNAAEAGVALTRLALYEPPFIVDGSRPPVPSNYLTHLSELLADGRRGDALEYFLGAAVEVPLEMIAQMRESPMWAGMEAVAHTLPYDGAVMGDGMSGQPFPAGRWASVTAPALVMDGGDSPQWMHNGVAALAAALPNARRETLPGQTHAVAPEVVAPVLRAFFSE